MKYDLSNPYKLECAKAHFHDLEVSESLIELKEVKLKRSLDQNSLYWVWLQCIEKETGISKNDSHLLYRALYLQKDEERITKIIYTELWNKLKIHINQFHCFKGLEEIIDVIAESTTALEKDRFSEYLKKIQVHARSNMGVILLNLEDQNFYQFYKEFGFI